MQSAATRNASARTEAIADSRVAPYAITPGIDSISAHQRPSSSNPTTIGMDSTVILSIDFPLYYRPGALIEFDDEPLALFGRQVVHLFVHFERDGDVVALGHGHQAHIDGLDDGLRRDVIALVVFQLCLSAASGLR